MAKTRRDLVNEALKNLGVGSAGQSVPADDFAEVDDEVDPFLAELDALHGILVQDDEAIEDAWFRALSDMLAARKITAFAIGPVEAAELKTSAAQGLVDLKKMVANRPTYQVLRTDYF